MDSTSIVSVSETGNNSKWPIFPPLRNILLLLYIFTFSHFFLYLNKVFVFVVVVVVNKSDSSAVPAMCSMCLPTHELIVPVWTYRTVTCEVAACAYMSARCLFAVCTIWTCSHAVWCNWSEYTCCRNRHPCPSPIPLILHKTNHVLCVSIDVPLLHFA